MKFSFILFAASLLQIAAMNLYHLKQSEIHQAIDSLNGNGGVNISNLPKGHPFGTVDSETVYIHAIANGSHRPLQQCQFPRSGELKDNIVQLDTVQSYLQSPNFHYFNPNVTKATVEAKLRQVCMPSGCYILLKNDPRAVLKPARHQALLVLAQLRHGGCNVTARRKASLFAAQVKRRNQARAAAAGGAGASARTPSLLVAGAGARAPTRVLPSEVGSTMSSLAGASAGTQLGSERRRPTPRSRVQAQRHKRGASGATLCTNCAIVLPQLSAQISNLALKVERIISLLTLANLPPPPQAATSAAANSRPHQPLTAAPPAAASAAPADSSELPPPPSSHKSSRTSPKKKRKRRQMPPLPQCSAASATPGRIHPARAAAGNVASAGAPRCVCLPSKRLRLTRKTQQDPMTRIGPITRAELRAKSTVAGSVVPGSQSEPANGAVFI